MSRAEIEQHVRGWKPGPRGQAPPRPIAAGAWRAEGEWQSYEQMDIWECIDLAEFDRRERGEINDDGE